MSFGGVGLGVVDAVVGAHAAKRVARSFMSADVSVVSMVESVRSMVLVVGGEWGLEVVGVYTVDICAACCMVRSCESAWESIEAERDSSPELESLKTSAATCFHSGISILCSLGRRSAGVLRTFEALCRKRAASSAVP